MQSYRLINFFAIIFLIISIYSRVYSQETALEFEGKHYSFYPPIINFKSYNFFDDLNKSNLKELKYLEKIAVYFTVTEDSKIVDIKYKCNDSTYLNNEKVIFNINKFLKEIESNIIPGKKNIMEGFADTFNYLLFYIIENNEILPSKNFNTFCKKKCKY